MQGAGGGEHGEAPQGRAPVLEAIRTGARGGHIACADLGSAATCQEEGTQYYPTFAEAGLLPPTTMAALRKAGSYSVPDAVLGIRGERGKRDYVSLLELKYCRDGMDETGKKTTREGGGPFPRAGSRA